MLNQFNTESLLGFSVTTDDVGMCAAKTIGQFQDSGEPIYFACLNPHSFELSQSDQIFKEALQNANFLIPDGIGIVLASRLFKGCIRHRITGSDLFLEITKLLQGCKKSKYFFLGSSEIVLLKIKERMKIEFPELEIAGMLSPPFKDSFSSEENRKMIEAVNESQPDVVWIGMTAPKQEKWVFQNRKCLKAKFIGPIGAAFDYFARTESRCPKTLQKLGVEWLFRLIIDPRRLWKRTFISAPIFLIRILKIRFCGRKQQK